MGKGILILVLASSYLLVETAAIEMEASAATEEVRTEYLENILARELAHSAFNLVVSKTTLNFTTYRTEDADKAYSDGMYAFSASGDSQGPVSVTAYGEVGGAVHLIQAQLERSGRPVLDAMTIDGPISSVTGNGNSFIISGIDKAVDEEEGLGQNSMDGHAITTVLEPTKDAFLDSIDGSQLVGRGGSADVVTMPANVDLDELEDSILEHPDLITLEGSQRLTGNSVYGSPENPILLRVDGDLTVRGSIEGYGILMVNGSFSNAGTLRWEGLVMLSSSGGDHEFKGNTDLYGALVMRSRTHEGETGGYEDLGLANGHFDIDVFNAASDLTYHQHQYDDRFDVSSVDFLKAGCELDGGLCWQAQVQSLELSQIRVVVSNYDLTEGTFSFETTSSLQTGPISEGFEKDLDPSTLTGFSFSFTEACGIQGTSPGEVWSDTTERGSQLRVQVFDPSPEDGGDPAILIHEVVVYRHSSFQECDSEDEGKVDVEPISFYINGNVGIHLSTSALARVVPLISELDAPDIQITMTNIRQTSTRH